MLIEGRRELRPGTTQVDQGSRRLRHIPNQASGAGHHSTDRGRQQPPHLKRRRTHRTPHATVSTGKSR